ncbi:beta strand repeat-containing protein [Prosthecobacter fluviatilis]|uniref:Beta strand repeat-containing protein n=1 Tax=Prosthecobacter fluviatilis TaxID=445931 RepID=A0ABW0KR80_9BACT
MSVFFTQGVRFAVLLFSLVAVVSSPAATLYWDANGTAVSSGNAGGVWGVDSFWSTDARGLSSTGAYVTGSDVVFAAGVDGTGTYTVTLSPGQSASSLNFQEGHVTIAPGTAFVSSPNNFTSVEILTLTGTAPVVNVQNMDVTITARMNSTGLTKNGLGKLTLDFGASGNASFFNLGSTPITINAGTFELKGTGGSANQLATSGIVINSGGTFLWNTNANSVGDSAKITVNVGGVLNTKVSDQVGTIEGGGLILMRNASLNLAQGGVSTTFSGIIAGSGTLQVNGGTGFVTLTNANTFAGTLSALNTSTATGGFVLGHARAVQNATINLVNFDVNTKNISFASGIGTFITGGLQGTSNLTLQDAGGSAITLHTGNNDSTTTYRGALSGSGGLTKIGTGTLTLSGEQITVTRTTTSSGAVTATYVSSTSNTYTGDTTILGGSHNPVNGALTQTNASGIKLDFNSTAIAPATSGTNTYTYTITAPTADIISASSRLVLGGGKLTVAGRNTTTGAAPVSQTFNGTYLLAGRSYVTVTQGTANTDTVVNLGSISRDRGSILEFTPAAGTQSATNGITTTTANDASGILGGWALLGNDWAVKSTAGPALGNVVVATTQYSTYAGGDIVSSPASNLLISDSSTSITTASGVTTLNTIMVRNDAGNGNAALNRLIDIAAGETLRLGATGSIWNQGSQVTSGVPTLTIGSASSVGTLTAGGADNTAGELIINNSGSGEMLIRSSITDNGTGAVTLIRTGSGNQVVFSGVNTYTGGTIITLGRNRFDSVGSLGSGAVTVTAGGQLWLNAGGSYAQTFNLAGTGYGENGIPGAIRFSGGQTLTGQINLTGDTRLGAVNASNVTTFTGKITGDYALDLSGGAGGTNIIQLNNTANDFTGNLSINTNFGTSPTAFNSANVTVRLGASEVIPNGLGKGNVILSGSSSTSPVTLDLNGFSETINSLISYGTHANTAITNGKAGTTSTLTIGDNNSSTLVTDTAAATTFFGGVIKDTGTGIMALTKIGEGTQTFTGANTYSGATTISKGILMAGAVNTLSASSAVTLANDPTAMLALTNGLADFSQTILSLAGGGTVNLGTIAAADTMATPGTRLTTGSSADTTYSGTIAGAGGLVKQGSGTFTLTGANTYVGTTQVTAGNLQVGQAGTGQSGNGAVVVSSGATLSGSGTVQGATVINGLLSAGDSGGTGIGRLTFTDVTTGSLTLSGGGSSLAPRVLFTLAGATGNDASPADGIQTAGLLNGSFGNHDALVVQGTLTLAAGSTIKVELASGYDPTFGDVINLIDWGTVNGGASAIVAGGFNAASTGGDLDLQLGASMIANGWFWDTDQFLTDGIIYVVPEPGRAMLLLLGLGLGSFRRRRR